MAAVSRAWLSELARPTGRFTRRAAHWTASATDQAARGVLRRAHSASRRVARSLQAARERGQERLRAASRELRKSMLPEAGAQMKRLSDAAPKSLALVFLASITTGAVYGLSGQLSQALTTAVCSLTIWLVFVSRETQAREARALRQSLDELRESLRVTHALLEASELQDVEELRSSLLPRESAPPRAPAHDSTLPDDAEDDQTRRVSTTAMAAI
jgi:hypothetical protein